MPVGAGYADGRADGRADGTVDGGPALAVTSGGAVGRGSGGAPQAADPDLPGRNARAAGHEPELVEMPDFASSILSWFGFLPGAPITRDQWIMLQKDNVASGPGLEAFGIQPTPLAAVAPEWLGRFHEGGRFASRRSQSSVG